MAHLYNPSAVAFGGTTNGAISQATQVTINEGGGATPVGDDNDTWNTGVIPGMGTVSATVAANDMDAGGSNLSLFNYTSLTATFQVAQGSTASMVIAKAMYHGKGGGIGYGGGAAAATYNFMGYSADGTTNPIAWTGA